ncbi:EAL domain-containing protein [Paracoccaceae bacterium GXU_MW_L88]
MSAFQSEVIPIEAGTLAHAVRRRAAVQLVEDAITENRFELAFQPVVSRDIRTPAFYEGLVRIRDRAGSLVPAGEFIPFIEHADVGRIIDRTVLGQGIRTLREHPHMRLSVNMSSLSIGDADYTALLHDALDNDPATAERLIIEITESVAMFESRRVSEFMHDIHNLGVSFAMDDFGAGYTAFRHFRDFAFDMVKVDGQFTREVNRSEDNQVLIRALVSIAEHFGMFTVAEFVETEEEARTLEKLGVQAMQGFHFGRPAPLSELPK